MKLSVSNLDLDCLRLRFSMFADIARVTNVRIIIIIIVIKFCTSFHIADLNL